MSKVRAGGVEEQNQDNWVHRSTSMFCRSCMWWVEKKASSHTLLDEATGERQIIGRCRRHAPSMQGFVPTFSTDWCGDHRLDENRM